jgi:hypothetical protein
VIILALGVIREEVLVSLPLPSGNPLFNFFTFPDTQTICHRGLHPLSELCEGMSGGGDLRRSSRSLSPAGLHRVFQMSRMSTQGRLFSLWGARLENSGSSQSLEKVCFRILCLWLSIRIDDQDQSFSIGERIKE